MRHPTTPPPTTIRPPLPVLTGSTIAPDCDALPDGDWLAHLAADVLSPLPVEEIVRRQADVNELTRRIVYDQWARVTIERRA